MPRRSDTRTTPAIAFPTDWWRRVKIAAALVDVHPAVFSRQAIMQRVAAVEAEHGIEGGVTAHEASGKIRGAP